MREVGEERVAERLGDVLAGSQGCLVRILSCLSCLTKAPVDAAALGVEVVDVVLLPWVGEGSAAELLGQLGRHLGAGHLIFGVGQVRVPLLVRPRRVAVELRRVLDHLAVLVFRLGNDDLARRHELLDDVCGRHAVQEPNGDRLFDRRGRRSCDLLQPQATRLVALDRLFLPRRFEGGWVEAARLRSEERWIHDGVQLVVHVVQLILLTFTASALRRAVLVERRVQLHQHGDDRIRVVHVDGFHQISPLMSGALP